MEEQWKEIPGYDGKYQISNMGRIEEAKKLRQRAEMKFLEERGFYENIYN